MRRVLIIDDEDDIREVAQASLELMGDWEVTTASSGAEGVRRQVADAVAAGATAHVERQLFPADRPGTAWLMPQVLTAVDHGMDVMREESFGPVVGLMPVDDDEEALRLMNDSRYGLTASIWTADAEAALRIGDAVDMVDMRMRKHKTNGCKCVIAEESFQLLLLVLLPATGIDDDRIGTVVHHVGVLLKRVEGELCDVEHARKARNS